MRFLLDNAVSPVLCERLRQGGHDAVHVRDLQMTHAKDEVIFEAAQRDRRIIISADTDFAALLALRSETKPSLILFRLSRRRGPEFQASALLSNLPALEYVLNEGCVAIIEDARVRVRPLPIIGE